MKKKILFLMVAFLCAINANAQFEEGKVYVGGSLTGLNLSYNGSSDLNLGLQANVGYFFLDNLMLHGTVGYQHYGNDLLDDTFNVGVGGRYYITQNGIFLGANCKWLHSEGFDDVMPGVEVGYAFFLSRTVTVEPSIYYQQSFKDHKDYSTIGLNIGVGLYLFKD